MLLRFGVANHRSIRDYQELHLSASRRVRRSGQSIPAPTLGESAVPVVALYGGNAAGKSNLIDAMDAFRRLIVRSHTSLGAADPIPRDPFRLDDASSAKPTRFDCTFVAGEGTAGTVYEYGFEYVDAQFQREWLFRIVRKKRQSTQLLFERATGDGRIQVQFGSHLRGSNRAIVNWTRPNSLFLSAAAQNNHPLLADLYRHFAGKWTTVLSSEAMNGMHAHDVAKRLAEHERRERLLAILRQADVGIIGMHVEDEEVKDSDETSLVEAIRRRKRLRFMHAAAGDRAAAFGYATESRGTQVLVCLLVPALEALERGSLLVIDELDTSLHPNLARAFVSLFARKESNPRGAQLVFSTHDVALLGSGVLDSDAIWLIDKTGEGESRFTPLMDFQLRSRDDIEKAYRLGRFGGVPAGDDFFIDLRAP